MAFGTYSPPLPRPHAPTGRYAEAASFSETA